MMCSPSGDQDGMNSFVSKFVSRVAAPSGRSITHSLCSALKATCEPSSETAGQRTSRARTIGESSISFSK